MSYRSKSNQVWVILLMVSVELGLSNQMVGIILE